MTQQRERKNADSQKLTAQKHVEVPVVGVESVCPAGHAVQTTLLPDGLE